MSKHRNRQLQLAVDVLSTSEAVAAVAREVSRCPSEVPAASVDRSLNEISHAERIFVAGAGRSGLAAQGFAKIS